MEPCADGSMMLSHITSELVIVQIEASQVGWQASGGASEGVSTGPWEDLA